VEGSCAALQCVALITSAVAVCCPQVPVEVNVELLQQLKDMGFGETRAARGLHFSGNSTLEVRGCVCVGGGGGSCEGASDVSCWQAAATRGLQAGQRSAIGLPVSWLWAVSQHLHMHGSTVAAYAL
jgi:hypothetical protein